MPAKYRRDRQAMSVKVIKGIIASLKAQCEGEDLNSGIGSSEDEDDETVAEINAVESSVLEQASARSGGEQRKPLDGDNKRVRQCEVVKAGPSEAGLAEQATDSENLLNPKLDHRMSQCPIQASLPRGRHYFQNATLAR